MNTAEVETVSKPISFDTHHDDVIHDAKVDFYGRRLATASSDRTIRIFQINENETETLLSILSGHEGPVWQVAWAHPKFGPILASCSYDGSVIIWQEDKQQKSQNPAGTHSTWTKVKVHRVHNSSVNSISFAPHAFGLHLACASSDGKVSILSQIGDEWQSQVISAHPSGCNSVAWAPSAVPSSLFALNFRALDEEPLPLGPKMIATGGCDNTVKLWKSVEEEGEDGGVSKEKWRLEGTLDDHTDWVRDVCWRPNLGQVDHMLVSCSQDKTVLIWKLNEETKKWESKPLKQQPFPDTLWRVSFSEYGHLLAVSCGDNTVTIWKENFDDGTWELTGNVNETVTESVKIEEPLAIAPPASAPIPDIKFTSSKKPNIVSDVVYMKPMSPMIPAPSIPSAGATPGYQQFNQEYDDYQHAQTPNIPMISQPLINSEILATAVIPEPTSEEFTTNENVYNANQYETENNDYQQQEQQFNQYTETIQEFNKDIGFVTSTPLYEIEQIQNQLEQTQIETSYEQATYDQINYDQTAVEQTTYDQPSYDQVNYEQMTYESQYDPQSQPNYEQYEQQSYEQQSYEQQTYDQQSYGQGQGSYYPVGEINYYPEGDVQQQQQEGYNAYYQSEVTEELQPQEEKPVDYTLQYEGYNPSASYNEDPSRF